MTEADELLRGVLCGLGPWKHNFSSAPHCDPEGIEILANETQSR
jgi:hypothetical protein